MNHRLERHRWPTVPDRPIVLLPLGSTEQHGPHLPLMTDTCIAEAVARAMAPLLHAATGTGVLVAPALPYGASGEHQAFPGTISIGHQALRITLIEAIRSLSTWSGRIILVNGHGGNAPTVRSVVDQLQAEHHQVTWVACEGGSHEDTHAGRHETSLMLHLDAESVLMDMAEPGNIQPLPELMPQLVRSGVAQVSANGVLGDPTMASTIEGADTFESLVSSAVRQALTCVQ